MTPVPPPNDAFVYVRMTDPRVTLLLQDLYYEYEVRYPGHLSAADNLVAEAEKYPAHLFLPPGGAFLLLLRDGQPIAGGAFMQIDARTVELKRIWTHADFRRQGLSSRVLAELEAEAARRGFTRVYLTTGTRQPEAMHLYLKTGYTPLYDLAADITTLKHLAFEKVITPVSTEISRFGWLTKRLHAWQQQRQVKRVWRHHAPIARRLDDRIGEGATA